MFRDLSKPDSNKSKSILIAEDEPSLLATLAKRLQSLNCQVITAVDGEDAYKKFETFKPGILITDIIMPKLNGFDLIQKLRVKYADTFKVVVLTNIDSPQDAEMAKSLNVGDYLSKSDISLRAIQQKIQALL